MEYRLYILAGTFVLVLVAFVVLAIVLVRARKATRVPPEPDVMSQWPMLKPAPEEVEANLRAKFSEPTTGVAAVLNEPIRTGSWQPAPGEDEPQTQPRSDYWDSLIDEPATLMRDREGSVDPAPSTSSQVVERAQKDAEIDHLIDELDVQEEPVSGAEENLRPTPTEVASPTAPTPPTDPVLPAPPTAPTPPTTPTLPTEPVEDLQEPESAIAPTPVEAAPVPAPEPIPVADVPEPEVTPAPVPSAAPAPEPGPAPAPAPPPAVPAARTARVTAAPAKAAAHPQPTAPQPSARPPVPSAKREQPASEKIRASAGRKRPDKTPEHELVAPVEMWFGDDRVGVHPGSGTYDLFQKYARVLLDDLKRSNTSSLA